MPVGKWISVRFRTSRRLEAEMSQISEGSALVLALACALWIYEVTKVMHAAHRLISRPATMPWAAAVVLRLVLFGHQRPA